MDGPAFLPVGTEVSAKYRGAFCEAKVKKIVRSIKIKVSLNETGLPLVVTDEDIKGPLKLGCSVGVKHPESGQLVEATINKITDQSMYTVVFDDGDENTLRRTQLCLKGEKHYVKTDTLDELPLTNPEHFGTPVLKGSKKKRRAALMPFDSDSDDSSDEITNRKYWGKLQDLVGKVYCMQQEDRKKSMMVPVLVVHPNADDVILKTRDHILVKSFKDSKIYPVLKKELKDFTRETAMKNEDKALKAVYEKALLYFDAKELPQNWDREEVFGTDSSDNDDDEDPSSDDEQSEEKDMFVAQLYKFMDDRGTPINKAPVIGTRDLNLYRLFRVVQKLGGYNRVTNQMKWRLVYSKMILPNTATAANQIKAAYKKYLHAYEDFYRKLGSSMGTIRSNRGRHSSSRNIPGFRDRGERSESSPKSRVTGNVNTKKNKEELGDPVTEEAKGSESKSIKIEHSETESPSKRKTRTGIEEKSNKFAKDPKKSPKPDEDSSKDDGKQVKKRPVRKKIEKSTTVVKQDELNVGKKSSAIKIEKREVDQQDSGDESAEDAKSSKTNVSEESNEKKYEIAEYPPGSKLKVKYGKGKNQTYFEAKVVDCENEGGVMHYLVHYNGWNVRYDEWVKKDRIVSCVYKSDGKKPLLASRPTLPGTKLQAFKKKMVSGKSAKADKEEKSAKTPSAPQKMSKDLKPPRPTRSTSHEANLALGLAKKKKVRSISGYSETSRSQRSYEDSSDSENSDEEETEEDDQTREPAANSSPNSMNCPSSSIATKLAVSSRASAEKSPHHSGSDSNRESAFDILKVLQASTSDLEFDKESPEVLERDLNIKMPPKISSKMDSDEEMDIEGILSCLKNDEYKFPSSENESVKSEGQEKRRGKTKTKGELKGKPDVHKIEKGESSTGKVKVDSTPNKLKTESQSTKNKIDSKSDSRNNKEEQQLKSNKSDISKTTKASELPRAKIELSKVKDVEMSPKRKDDASPSIKQEKFSSRRKADSPKSKTEKVVKTKAEMKMVVSASIKDITDKTKDSDKEPAEKSIDKQTTDKGFSSSEELSSASEKTRSHGRKENSDIEKESKLDTPTKSRGRGRGKRKAIVEKENEDSEDEPLRKKTRKKVSKKGEKSIEDTDPKAFFSCEDKVDKVDDVSKNQNVAAGDQQKWINAPELTATSKLELESIAEATTDAPAPSLSPILVQAAVDKANMNEKKETLKTAASESRNILKTAKDSLFQINPAQSSALPFPPPLEHSVLQSRSVVEQQSPSTLPSLVNVREGDSILSNTQLSAVDNTPPETPENLSANETPSHEPAYDQCSTRSEMEANYEVEKFLQGADPPGGESPSVYDAGNVSTASDDSSSDPKVHSDVAVATTSMSSGTKRKIFSEDIGQTSVVKRRRSKKGSHHYLKQKYESKRDMSDYEDDESKEMLPGTSKSHPQHSQPSSSSSFPALSKDMPIGPSKYDFTKQLEKVQHLEREDRVNFLFSTISDLRTVYMQLKAEVAAIDKKRKKYRKKQRLAQEAAAQCLIGLEQSVL